MEARVSQIENDVRQIVTRMASFETSTQGSIEAMGATVAQATQAFQIEVGEAQSHAAVTAAP